MHNLSLKVEQKIIINTKGGFQCLYVPLMLIEFIEKMKTIILKCF